jgi:S-adenosylmethionine:tRNA ribosyltransferase-isomerase
MIAATAPRSEPLDERLLVIDPNAGSFRDAHVHDLASFVAAGDLLVVNDAATLPASLQSADGEFELRLIGGTDSGFDAILFGAGDFRTPTERRPEPPRFSPGDVLRLSGGLGARVLRVDPEEPRLVAVGFDRTGADFYRALYAGGRPIQYAHVPEPLALWSVQNRFAARPWAFELPSAGRPLTWSALIAMKRKGVAIASVTHAAGVSSTGSERLDRRLPLREHYAVGAAAVAAVRRAKEKGGRVLAAGTTVVRALESAALEHEGRLAPTEGDTSVVIGPGFRPAVVDGILSGMHARGTSHYSLLRAFASEELLDRALEHAERAGYLEHEFGDSCVIWPSHS